jgi:hypothetical protein
MRLAVVPVGIGAPNVLQQTQRVDPSVPSITDLTTVTGVSLNVSINGAAPVVWSATILAAFAATPTSLSYMIWQHAFASADCAVEGVYVIAPQLTVPGGSIPCGGVRLYVSSIVETW